MKKVALYCRVSTADQTNETQRVRLVDYAKAKGLGYDIFEEVESTRKARPVKADMLQRLRNGEYEAVIVYKLDRYARSSSELILEVAELLKKNIGFISISDSLDFTTATGKLHFQILSAFAEFERSLISERTKESLYRKKMNGQVLGRPVGSKDKQKRKTDGYFSKPSEEPKDDSTEKNENTNSQL